MIDFDMVELKGGLFGRMKNYVRDLYVCICPLLLLESYNRKGKQVRTLSTFLSSDALTLLIRRPF